ncbi:hypothetical protein L3Q82_025498 [Scortum barcoo]|uniref:Uncharacterized protein n=1 Tax=Scortum barcoo TaxID=214431 RepID=A0ACB8WLL0_9TELE|nr:hypothetical protein L3Q82_025498 [Scortum barcoo]
MDPADTVGAREHGERSFLMIKNFIAMYPRLNPVDQQRASQAPAVFICHSLSSRLPPTKTHLQPAKTSSPACQASTSACQATCRSLGLLGRSHRRSLGSLTLCHVCQVLSRQAQHVNETLGRGLAWQSFLGPGEAAGEGVDPNGGSCHPSLPRIPGGGLAWRYSQGLGEAEGKGISCIPETEAELPSTLSAFLVGILPEPCGSPSAFLTDTPSERSRRLHCVVGHQRRFAVAGRLRGFTFAVAGHLRVTAAAAGHHSVHILASVTGHLRVSAAAGRRRFHVFVTIAGHRRVTAAGHHSVHVFAAIAGCLIDSGNTSRQ